LAVKIKLNSLKLKINFKQNSKSLGIGIPLPESGQKRGRRGQGCPRPKPSGLLLLCLFAKRGGSKPIGPNALLQPPRGTKRGFLRPLLHLPLRAGSLGGIDEIVIEDPRESLVLEDFLGFALGVGRDDSFPAGDLGGFGDPISSLGVDVVLEREEIL